MAENNISHHKRWPGESNASLVYRDPLKSHDLMSDTGIHDSFNAPKKLLKYVLYGNM